MNIYLATFHGRSGGSTQISSLTGYEPKVTESNVIETEAIEPEDLEPTRIELDRNLGTDRYQIQGIFLRAKSFAEDVDGFGKVGCKDVLPPVTDAFRLGLSG